MRRALLLSLVIAGAALGALAVVRSCARAGAGAGAGAGVTVDISGVPFTLEVAADDATRTRGLMERREIPAGTGMLFAFPEPEVLDFWMGHCLVDIDIIFLDPRGRVTATHRMKAQPPQAPGESEAAYRARLGTYSSVLPAQFAIELPAGSVERLGVAFEQRLSLDLDRLKALARAADQH